MEETKTQNNAVDLDEARANMEDNLEAFRKKFLLFFIGLCCFAAGIVINAFGAIGVASFLLFGGMGCWGGPLAVKFWFSGFGSLFDFRYRVFEVYRDGRVKDVTTVGDVMTGPFIKCVVALLVVLLGTIIAPMEMIVRLMNHIRFEKLLGEKKGAIVATPRREAILCVIVLVAMFVLAIIGNIITNIRENTSDIGNEQVIELLETLEAKTKSYSILNTRSVTLAEVAESGDTVTFTVLQKIELTHRPDSASVDYYEVAPGTYTYMNGVWKGADENAAFLLSKLTIGIALDLDAMKENPKGIVINRDVGLSGRVDNEEHNYYEIKPKNNSKEFDFEEFLLEENFAFGTLSTHNYVYIFN